MLSIEQCRQIDAELRDKTDEEVRQIRDTLFELANMAMDSWVKMKATPTPHSEKGMV